MTAPLFELFVPRRGVDWINQNEIKGKHWGAVQKLKDGWRSALWVAINQAGIKGAQPAATLHVELHFNQRRIRDPLNWTPTMKVLVDQMVKVYHFWPDDNPEWLSQPEPTIVIAPIEGILIRAVARTEPLEQPV